MVEGRIIELDWRVADPGDLTDILLLDLDQGISYICREANRNAEELDIEAN